MKRISGTAICALKEALSVVYWYKRDLKAFLFATVRKPELLTALDWGDYKRNVVGALIDRMAANQQAHQEDLLNLISDVCDIKDFSHLLRLEDGQQKELEARRAVEILRGLYTSHQEVNHDRQVTLRRREDALRRLNCKRTTTERLGDIRRVFASLLADQNEQARGYALERIIRQLFELFDLDPRASFRVSGEQIDGSFTFDSTDYLFEGKWQKRPVAASDLDSFSAKVARRLDNTLGLFLSLNGFSREGVEAHSRGELRLILMDGADLNAVIDERIELPQLLLRKRRHAAETGEIYLSASTFMYS